MFQTKFVAKIKTHILCSVTLFRQLCQFEIMWENVVDPERQRMRAWRMRIARCIPKATNTQSEYVILNAVYLKHGHTNAPPCYVIPKLPVFFSLASSTAA